MIEAGILLLLCQLAGESLVRAPDVAAKVKELSLRG